MQTDENLKKTPLCAEHERLNAKMAPFGGWLMPIQYEGILAEHAWCRAHAGLFDICHMGEFFVSGDVEKTGLNRIVTVNVATMKPGSCKYGFALNEQGGIIDDLVVYRLEPSRWMIVVNAATTPNDAAHFKKHLSPQTQFEDASSRLGKLDLQGPKSADILSGIAGPRIRELGYYRFDTFDILGERAIVSRSGYTGELGYELYLSAAKTVELWQLLLKHAQVKPIGLGARDTLRLEMGYPLYGQDLSEEFTPLEAGFEKFLDLQKDFIGRDALRKAPPGGRRLVSFMAESRRSPRHNFEIYYHDKRVGIVTSGSFSPSLGRGIGMGYMDIPISAGEKISVRDNHSATSIDAVIVERPFYKDGTAKSEVQLARHCERPQGAKQS